MRAFFLAPPLLIQPMADLPQAVLSERVAQRRTFAIISHPDAGKTTLTEKLLLFAGAIQIARCSATSRRTSQRKRFMRALPG